MMKRAPHIGDKNLVVAGSFMSYYSFFERQLEELFVGLVTGVMPHPQRNLKPTVTFLEKNGAIRVLSGGRPYLDWMPFDKTRARAQIYFSEPNPFMQLSKPHRALLEQMGVLRNALAHQSAHSLRKFDVQVVDGAHLPAGQQTPAGYLRGEKFLGVTRLEYYLNGSVSAMNNLCL